MCSCANVLILKGFVLKLGSELNDVLNVADEIK